MPTCTTHTNARSWVLIFLLTYAGQLLGVSAYAFESGMAPSATMASCHDKMSMEMDTQDLKQTLESCCSEGECQMMNCHTASALISSTSTWIITPSSTLNIFDPSSSPTRPSSSLYRPPILG